MIRFSNVNKTYGSITALKNFNFSFNNKKTTVLIGPSGCGKSTVLRLINGLISPDTGTILINEYPLAPKTILETRRRMGYVIQEGGLFPHLSIKKNITLVARHLKWERDRIERRIELLIKLTQFPANRLNYFPAELSGGQRQRVSLMRALMLDPDILLLDEPLGALDPMIRSDLQKEMKQIICDLKKTAILVTHDMGEAAYMGDKIIVMKKGEICQSGSLESLLSTPASLFITKFINSQRSPLEKYFMDQS